MRKQFPAVEKLKQYAAQMPFPEQEGFPQPIREAAEKFRTLAVQGQVTGARMALKDLYEVALKTIVLTAAAEIYQDSENRTEERNRFLQVLFVKNPAFGYWKQEIGGTLQKLFRKEMPAGAMAPEAEALRDLLKVMEKEQIVAWRNQDAHGAAHDLQEESTVTELAGKWEALAAHWERKAEAYRQMPFGRIEMYPFVIWEEEQCFFFDSFLYDRERIVFLSYRNNRRILAAIQGVQAFYERFQVQPCPAEGLADVECDELTDREMELLNRPRQMSHLLRPEYLVSWLAKELEETDRGYLLLQMERGMGKSTFARMLDPAGQTGVKLPEFSDVTVRRYHMTPFYNRQSVISFTRELEHQFSHESQNGQEVRVFGGSSEARIPMSEDTEALRHSLADFLNRMRQMHEKRFGREKLLLVLDGADEVMTEAQQRTGVIQIPDILPDPEELEEGVYLLLLSRTDREMKPYRLWPRVCAGWSREGEPAGLAVYGALDPGYRKVVYEYVEKLVFAALSPEELNTFLQNGSWNFVFAAAATELIRLYRLSEPAELRLFLREIGGLEDLLDRYLEQLRFIYGKGYFEELLQVLLGLALRPAGKTLSALAKQRGEGGVTYRLAGMVRDLSPFVKEERDGRESRYACSNLLVRDLILKRYAAEAGELEEAMFGAWLETAGLPGPKEAHPADWEEEQEERKTWFLHVPFQRNRMERAAEKTANLLIWGADDLVYLGQLQVLKGRFQEAGEAFPASCEELLQEKQLEQMANISEFSIPGMIRIIEEAPEEWQYNLLKGFWRAYEKQLNRRTKQIRSGRHGAGEDTWGPALAWNEYPNFRRIWGPMSDAFYPSLTVTGAGLIPKEPDIGGIEAALDAFQTAYQNRKILIQDLWEKTGSLLQVDQVMFLEEWLLYIYLTEAWLLLTGEDKSWEKSELEECGNELVQVLWEAYGTVPCTEIRKDCLYWSLPVWAEERAADKEMYAYLKVLAERRGQTEREFLAACGDVISRKSFLNAAMIDQLHGADILKAGTFLKQKLMRALEEKKGETVWTYLQIEKNYLKGIYRKRAAYVFTDQLCALMYQMFERKDYENYLRAFHELAKQWQQLGSFQRRRLGGKKHFLENLTVMTGNMVYYLAVEGYQKNRRETDTILYRDMAWFGLEEETAAGLVQRWDKGETAERRLQEIHRIAREPKKTLGERSYLYIEQDLCRALNLACCRVFLKDLKVIGGEKPAGNREGWLCALEACAADRESLLDSLEDLVETPRSFAEWKAELEKACEAMQKAEKTFPPFDRTFSYAVVFRRMEGSWGSDPAFYAVWDRFLTVKLDTLDRWNWEDAWELKQKQCRMTAELKEEILAKRGGGEAARRQELARIALRLIQIPPCFAKGGSLFLWLAEETGETWEELEQEWEKTLLFVTVWLRLRFLEEKSGADREEKRKLRKILERKMEEREALPYLEQSSLSYMLESVLYWLLREAWDEETAGEWIGRMIPMEAKQWKANTGTLPWQIWKERFLTAEWGSLFREWNWSKILWPGRTFSSARDGWCRLEEQWEAYGRIRCILRAELEKLAKEAGQEACLAEEPPACPLSYEEAQNCLNQVGGKNREGQLKKVVNEVRQTAAWMREAGETGKARKLYEGILLVCRSCESEFLIRKDFAAEVCRYLSRGPIRCSFSLPLLGYHAAVLEYFDLIREEDGTEAPVRIYEAGRAVMRHIMETRKKVVSPWGRDLLTDSRTGFDRILDQVNEAAEQIGKAEEWEAEREAWG